MAGATNKDREFWEQIREWDVVVMMETCLMEEGWKTIKNRLPQGFKWEAQWTRKRNKNGRAMGDVNGKEKVVNKRRGREGTREVQEGMMMRAVTVEERKWKVVGVYVNGDMERKWNRIREWGRGGRRL